LQIAELFPDTKFEILVETIKKCNGNIDEAINKLSLGEEVELINSKNSKSPAPKPMPKIENNNNNNSSNNSNGNKGVDVESVNMINELFPSIPNDSIIEILNSFGGDVEKTIEALLNEKSKDDLRISSELNIPFSEDAQESKINEFDVEDFTELSNCFAEMLKNDDNESSGKNSTKLTLSGEFSLDTISLDEQLARALIEMEQEEIKKRKEQEQKDSEFAQKLNQTSNFGFPNIEDEDEKLAKKLQQEEREAKKYKKSDDEELAKRLLREDLEQRDLRMAKKLERDELVNTDENGCKDAF